MTAGPAPWPARTVFSAKGWTTRGEPPARGGGAAGVILGHAVPGTVAAVHRTESWLARMLPRPMLADLLEAGTWSGHREHPGMYRLCDRPVPSEACHALLVRNRALYAYRARHTAAACPDPAPDAPRGRAWFRDPEYRWDPPRDADRAAWRWLLHTSATAPVALERGVLHAHARVGGSTAPAPEALAGTYAAASSAAGFCLRLLPRDAGPGVWEIHEGPWLWRLDTTKAKPVAVSLRATAAARGVQVRRVSL